jgi:hypothetical protein
VTIFVRDGDRAEIRDGVERGEQRKGGLKFCFTKGKYLGGV